MSPSPSDLHGWKHTFYTRSSPAFTYLAVGFPLALSTIACLRGLYVILQQRRQHTLRSPQTQPPTLLQLVQQHSESQRATKFSLLATYCYLLPAYIFYCLDTYISYFILPPASNLTAPLHDEDASTLQTLHYLLVIALSAAHLIAFLLTSLFLLPHLQLRLAAAYLPRYFARQRQNASEQRFAAHVPAARNTTTHLALVFSLVVLVTSVCWRPVLSTGWRQLVLYSSARSAIMWNGAGDWFCGYSEEAREAKQRAGRRWDAVNVVLRAWEVAGGETWREAKEEGEEK